MEMAGDVATVAPRVRRRVSAALPVLLAMWCQPVGGQEPVSIRAGETVTGALTVDDPVLTGSGRFRVYGFEGRAGQRLVATLRSGAFDALLTLVRPVSGISETLGTDDDSGGGTDARLVFVVPANGLYHLVAQAYDADGVGGYTLTLEDAPPERASAAQSLAVGETRRGVIGPESGLMYDGGSEVLYDLYTFDARAGQRLVVLLESTDFDAFVAVGPMRGGVLEVTASDDDGGGGTNARLHMTIPAEGLYGIHARGLGGGDVGRYALTLRELVAAVPRPLTAGRDEEGRLGDDDVDGDGRNVQEWTYRGAAGETVRIRMRSDEFDTVLTFGRVEDGEFRELAANDDESDGSTNSSIEFRLPAAGEYVIRASGFEPGATGAYTLRLDSGAR